MYARFIPACAGNARRSGGPDPPGSVHPRVCGERAKNIEAWCAAHGSSPRVRGTQWRNVFIYATDRFIPACAGNAFAHSRQTSPTPVHPRVCGERVSDATQRLLPTGSSPRVRGTRFAADARLDDLRFIPACAGNASCRPRTRRRPAVHPRVCGERRNMLDALCAGDGSSPRVRGTPSQKRGRTLPCRFIPACAGNACRWPPAARSSPVHPRVCGERPLRPVRGSTISGSSPRVRGTLEQRHGVRPELRFIPACAGNAPPSSPSAGRWQVHPRVCGERSSHNLLIDESYPNMSLSTGKFGNVLLRSKRTAPLSYARSIAGARKRTSFMPSKSVGVRRLTPQVSKS